MDLEAQGHGMTFKVCNLGSTVEIPDFEIFYTIINFYEIKNEKFPTVWCLREADSSSVGSYC